MKSKKILTSRHCLWVFGKWKMFLELSIPKRLPTSTYDKSKSSTSNGLNLP